MLPYEKKMTFLLPKLIHQTFPTKRLPSQFAEISDDLRLRNPDWHYHLYDDNDVGDFVSAHYGADMLAVLLSISASYGAARADLFRYLLMYKEGGVYLDIKSTCVVPFSKGLTGSEGYVLSRWQNKIGNEFQGAGLHPELSIYPGGELQQWFIICEPRHPFLAAVIERVISNIAGYRPWSAGVGRTGVLRLTGPIAYTLAIEPIKDLHRHHTIRSHDDIGLRYNASKAFDHRNLFTSHYTRMGTAIVKPKGIQRASSATYIALRQLKHRLFRRNEDL